METRFRRNIKSESQKLNLSSSLGIQSTVIITFYYFTKKFLRDGREVHFVICGARGTELDNGNLLNNLLYNNKEISEQCLSCFGKTHVADFQS